jgi:hypothetical protein
MVKPPDTLPKQELEAQRPLLLPPQQDFVHYWQAV